LVRREAEDGWTLVELVIVVLVIGILLAIAIPTYLGAKDRSYDRAAQSDLRVALVAAKSLYSINGTYVCAIASTSKTCTRALSTAEPSLSYTTKASTTASHLVSATSKPTDLMWAAARMSESGTCFGIRDVQTGAPPTTVGTWYGRGLKTCTGNYARNVKRTPDTSWI
jgi:type IV pilus assembly protein PilA